MELWIRSQDKMALEQVFNLYILELSDEKYVIENNDSHLGEYKTKERALEVLDEIQKRITIEIHRDNLTFQEADIVLKGKIVDSLSVIYEMPKE